MHWLDEIFLWFFLPLLLINGLIVILFPPYFNWMVKPQNRRPKKLKYLKHKRILWPVGFVFRLLFSFNNKFWRMRQLVRARPFFKFFDKNYLYKNRHNAGIWFTYLAFSIFLFFGVFVLLRLLTVGEEKSNYWTFLLAVSAAPIAWLAFIIRDRNKLEDLKNEKYKQIRENFYKLQEWAVSDNAGQITTALFQLKDYLIQDERLIPDELSEYREHFAKLARDFFSVILKDRAIYDRHYRLWKESNGMDGKERESDEENEEDEGGNRAGDEAGKTASNETDSLANQPFYYRNELSQFHLNRFTTQVPLSHEDHYLIQAFKGRGLKDIPKSAPFRAMETIVREHGDVIRDLKEVQLEYAELNGAQLQKVDFSRAILTGADMREANMTGAYMSEANMTGADMARANMTGAYMSEANMTGADMARANMTGADMAGANLTGADMSDADLTGADMARANMIGADMSRANMTGANMYEANMTGANIPRANLTGVWLGNNQINHCLISEDVPRAILVTGGMDRDGEADWEELLLFEFPRGVSDWIKNGYRERLEKARVRETHVPDLVTIQDREAYLKARTELLCTEEAICNGVLGQYNFIEYMDFDNLTDDKKVVVEHFLHLYRHAWIQAHCRSWIPNDAHRWYRKLKEAGLVDQGD